jgi:natural product biosynthesis luciferase-like monooxygenase protein
VDLSLFYFSNEGGTERDRYRLLLSGARFADDHGFAAVWTPERHFHEFGGIFPNPSLTAAAVAAVTTRVKVRAGSVVAPLHHPLRIAEEWSVVDNISNGRAGLSLASGWHQRDFIFHPDAYAERRQITVNTISTLRDLWHAKPYSGVDAVVGEEYRVYPPPVQQDIPMWLTASGATSTFEAAGRAGVGVLTHLLSQSAEELATKITAYRAAFAGSGQHGRGHVVLMMHTYLDESLDAAHQHVRHPLKRYLMSSLDLNVGSSASSDGGSPTPRISEARASFVVNQAYERYLRRDGLFGSVADARAIVEHIRAVDVDEIACLIDFGIPADTVLSGLEQLAALREEIQ